MSERRKPGRAEQPHQDSHPGIATGNPLNAGGDDETRREEIRRREGDEAPEPGSEQEAPAEGRARSDEGEAAG